MIILGNHYQFTPYELKRLNRKVSQLFFIERDNRADKDIIQEVKQLLENHAIHLIVLNLKNPPSKELATFLTHLELQGIHYLTFSRFMEKYLNKCFIPDADVSLDYLQDIKPYGLSAYVLKRLTDYFISLTLLAFVWPVMLYAAYRIKKDSPGSIIFRQERIGLHGKPFTCLKFRSMHEKSHFDPYTRDDDPRIFDFGNFMRKTRIDELPQLFNVLKGDMHLIGPRAEWNILVEEYEKELPYYQERHLVRPGITGWAQIHYPYGRDIEDTRQKLMYDLYYIKNWSLKKELYAVFKTVKVVLTRQGT
jgi:lipopolysaccharide/colanic/teichoic acid biosynthesis glycosyltransferase